MRLIDALLGRSERFTMPDPGQSLMMSSFGKPDHEKILPGWHNTTTAYGSSAVVFGVIRARMDLFCQAEFKFQRLEDKSLYGSEALLKLEKPWPGGTTGELLARMEQDVSLAGNAYIHDAGEHLERLRPDWVTIISELVEDARTGNEVTRVVGYLYDPPVTEGRAPAVYPEAEVAHWSPDPDPLAKFRGMSWLTPVLREVDADLQMTDYKRAYLENAATPNLLVRYSQRVGQEKVTRLAQQMQARHGGVKNAFRTLILDEGADVTVVGHNFEQMAYAATQAAGENRIAVAGGVPAIVAGLKEGLDAATYSNYGMAMRAFADGKMSRNWQGACAALAKLIDVPGDSKLWYDTSQIPALQEGEKEKADTMAILASAASTLITSGYSPESVKAALAASDVTLLNHTGLVSVQLQKPGTESGSEPTSPKEGLA